MNSIGSSANLLISARGVYVADVVICALASRAPFHYTATVLTTPRFLLVHYGATCMIVPFFLSPQLRKLRHRLIFGLAISDLLVGLAVSDSSLIIHTGPVNIHLTPLPLGPCTNGSCTRWLYATWCRLFSQWIRLHVHDRRSILLDSLVRCSGFHGAKGPHAHWSVSSDISIALATYVVLVHPMHSWARWVDGPWSIVLFSLVNAGSGILFAILGLVFYGFVDMGGFCYIPSNTSSSDKYGTLVAFVPR